jgi:hypothetical protein
MLQEVFLAEHISVNIFPILSSFFFFTEMHWGKADDHNCNCGHPKNGRRGIG